MLVANHTASYTASLSEHLFCFVGELQQNMTERALKVSSCLTVHPFEIFEYTRNNKS